MTLNHYPDATTARDALPDTIETYLIARAARDDGRVLSAFTADAVVTDEGHDHAGREQIEAWLSGPASEYTYTTEFTSATTMEAGSCGTSGRPFPARVGPIGSRTVSRRVSPASTDCSRRCRSGTSNRMSTVAAR
jgi:hypothetical protein